MLRQHPKLTDIHDVDAGGALGELEGAEGDSECYGEQYEAGDEERTAAPPAVRSHRGDLATARTAGQLTAQRVEL